ncbi:MAG: hypothetical protein V4760_11110 [Bdellovibrionota bacterium]
MKKGIATQITFLVLSVLAFAACGKNGGDSQPPVATVPTYGIVGSQCMNTLNNTPVAYNLCQQNVAGAYMWNGTQCLQTNGHAVVDPSLCNGQVGNQYGNQYGNGGYQVGQGAGGPYVWNPYPNGQYPIGYFPTGYPSFPGHGGGSGGNYTSQVCNGIYLWTSGGSSRWVTCNGFSCRGYFVYTQTTYRPILCL